jgi:hypothetical protein
MNEQEPLDQRNLPEEKESEILVNEYGETRDPAVVVDEPNRTVLLTQDETIVIDKEPRHRCRSEQPSTKGLRWNVGPG